MFAVLGNIEFEALGSPEQMRRERAMHFAEHKVVEGFPRLQQIGNELDQISIDLKFHRSFTNPRAQRDAIHAALDAGKALALVWASGEHWGYFVIEKATDTGQHLAADGNPIALEMNLSLKAWAPDSEFDPLAPPKPDTPPLALVSPGALAPGQSVAGTVVTNPDTGAQVVIFEAPITGASALTHNPVPSGASGPAVLYTDAPPSAITRADSGVSGATGEW